MARWLAPKDNVLNIWVAPMADSDGGACHHRRPQARHSHVRLGADSSHVLYMQDEGGTEEWHIFAVATRWRRCA